MRRIQLPKINCESRHDIQFKLNDRALKSWDKTIRAEKGRGDVAVISILSTIFPNDETSFSADKMIVAIKDAQKRPIELNINSPGGSYFEGITILNLLIDYPNQIVVNILGEAASAASLVAMAGERIRIYDGAVMMIHSASGLAMGNKKDMRDLADVLDKVDNAAASVYSSRTGLSRQRILEMMSAESWMTPEEAVKNKFADEVVKVNRKKVSNLSDDQLALRAAHGAQGARMMRPNAGRSGSPDASGTKQPASQRVFFPE